MKYILAILFFLAGSPLLLASISSVYRASELKTAITENCEQPLLMYPVDNCAIKIEWQERISAFSKKEGIRVFVGYTDDELRGVLTETGDYISGWISDGTKSWDIAVATDGNITYTPQHIDKCGNSPAQEFTTDPISFAGPSRAQGDSQWSDQRNESLVYNNGILYIYRLAIPIAYYKFVNTFSSDISRVKAYWAEMQALLNEMYIREMGVCFEIVDDDRLIITDPYYNYPSGKSAELIAAESTKAVNKLIGEENYDISAVLAQNNSGYNGLAALLGSYYKSLKGRCTVSITSSTTIAHEIGHMFASRHTFSYGGSSTTSTEPGTGQSLMSYGYPRTFFSAVSLFFIRRCLVRMPHIDYYNRTDTIGMERLLDADYDNFVTGIATHNNPPVINESKLKKLYRIPRDTYFQFSIEASDPDGDELNYMAHQADIYRESGATYLCQKPSSDPVIRYQPKWQYSWGTQKFVLENYSQVAPDVTGSFYFWLAVTDGKTVTDTEEFLKNPHSMCYDAFETKLEVVDGTPFKITSVIPNRSTCGDRLNITWAVDKNIFPADSRVRILLSDDFGKTFKYVLKESTPNDGSCEIILPHISIGQVKIDPLLYKTVRGGVIKIEEIDGIAYALSATSPVDEYDDDQYLSGGFMVYPSSITFQNTPERYVTVDSEADIPPVSEVTAMYGGKAIDVVFTETREGNTISRVWEASTSTGIKSAFEQIICFGQTTGIPDNSIPETNVNVYRSGNSIIVNGQPGKTIRVFDLTGVCLYNQKYSKETESISVPQGIYIVVVDGRSYKLAI